ncbi:STAS domain-containing protein [Streptomyces sp. V4-01]|uniref:STAS domain-containing protein n=1 Tax=Actinacidiphila polyblastidii TaxID=3110430 RepID=A0ABU7PE29_9ACTN|nr:STAS domain-containing protein [Streptomyces sp. V4-01]
MTSRCFIGPHHTVLELNDVVDHDTSTAVEEELRRLLPLSGPRAVVVDIRTSPVTSATLHLLLRLRATAEARSTALCVAARDPLARRVFRMTGLSRTLRVAATVGGALALARTCGPAAALPRHRHGCVRYTHEGELPC